MAYPKPTKAKRPKPGIPISDDIVLDLIKKHSGNISHVADALGCCRVIIQRKCNNNPELKEALTQARERWIDELEDSVWDRAKHSNDSTLQIFLLKTQAKHRGYDQSEAQNTAKDIATAAFDFILNKSKDQQ